MKFRLIVGVAGVVVPVIATVIGWAVERLEKQYGLRDDSPPPKSTHKLVSPPGSMMNSAARLLCTKKTYERVVEPAIADMRYEYFEALSEGSKTRACLRRIVGIVSIFMALGLHTLTKMVWRVWSAWRSIK